MVEEEAQKKQHNLDQPVGEIDQEECSQREEFSWPVIRFEVPPLRTHHFCQQFRTSSNPNNFLQGIKWSPDGSSFLTSSDDRALRIFPSPDNGIGYHGDPNSLTTDADSYPANLIVNEGEAIYDYCWYPYMSASDPVTCVFATTTRDHPIHLWDSTSGELRCTYRAYDAMDEITAAFCVGFNPIGTKIFAGYNKSIRIFDTHRPGRDFQQHSTVQGNKGGQSGIISAIAFSPCHTGMLATGSYNQTTAIYREDNMELLYILHGQEGGVTHVQFSKDGNYLYSGGRKDPYILCWDIRKAVDIVYKLYRSSENTNQRILFDIDPFGQHLGTGGQDGMVHIYNLRTGQWISSFQAALDTVTSIPLPRFCLSEIQAEGLFSFIFLRKEKVYLSSIVHLLSSCIFSQFVVHFFFSSHVFLLQFGDLLKLKVAVSKLWFSPLDDGAEKEEAFLLKENFIIYIYIYIFRGRGMEGGRRISASPRGPCSGLRRRVSANKRPRADGFVNSVKKLQRREISCKRDRSFSMINAQERFRNMRLTEEYDTHDPKGHCSLVLPFLMKRTKVIEIVAAHDIVFALAHSGVCAAFSRETNKRICFLNVSPDEVIRSLFYNKNNDSLITVSVYASDNFSSLKCRSTRIEYIQRGKPDAGFPLFESESLKWPGFVEFDDVNGKVLTYSAQDSIYKVFDLKNYSMLYSISDKNVQEIKISPGIMLLIFNKAQSHVPLKILSIEDGTVLKDFNHLLHRNKKVDFIEQFNEKLLVKQENENLQILDVRNAELKEVNRTEFMTPSAFIFLYENQLFLTFRNRTVAVWNFRGELVTSFEDHLLWHPDCNTNNIYITSDQDLIISYCKADSEDHWPEGNAGSINISNILTGKCLAKINASNGIPKVGCNGSESSAKKKNRSFQMRNTVAEALEDITALFYDEERNEIYTGNRHGLVHVWSN